jgi:RNA polymerase sigma-70 factor (ECF subfamily)
MRHDTSTGLAPPFDILLLAVLPSLRRQAMVLTRHHADAEDLVQTTIINALAARSSFQVGTNFLAWTTRILRNRFLSNVRGQRTTVDLEDAPPSLLARSGGQEETVIVRELEDLLLRLPANLRQILMMVSVDGLSYENAAIHLGVAAGTLKCRVFRARVQLQDWILDDAPRTDATHSAAPRRSTSLPSALTHPCIKSPPSKRGVRELRAGVQRALHAV